MKERLDAFMARANAAYYATHDPFRDFTTAPEITQVFGEILGLWAAVVWQDLGAPDPVLLVEAGPGRGTLMADALRAIRRAVPAFHAALRLHLIESSPRLRAVQGAALPDAVWHDDLATLPQGPLILLGNEFLDALPIRQFVRRGGAWAERFVEAGRFVEVATTPPPLEGLDREADQGWGRGRSKSRNFRRLVSFRTVGENQGDSGPGRWPRSASFCQQPPADANSRNDRTGRRSGRAPPAG